MVDMRRGAFLLFANHSVFCIDQIQKSTIKILRADLPVSVDIWPYLPHLQLPALYQF